MSAHLLPCPRCTRHVRVSALVCPFCALALDDAFRATPARPMPSSRLARAATYALGAALAVSACGPKAQNGDQGNGVIMQPYGAPPDPPHPPETPPPQPPQPQGPQVPPPPGTQTAPPTDPSTTPTTTPAQPGESETEPRGPVRRAHPARTVMDPGSAVAAYGVAPDPGPK